VGVALVLSPCVRILTVANHLGARGGLERTQLTNCRALAARGHRIDLVYVSAGDFAEEWERFTGSMVRTEGTLPRRRHPLSSTAAVATGAWAGKRSQPDVVYVYRYWDIPYAVAVGIMAGAPVVFHLCLPPPVRVPRWLRPCLGRVTRTLSVSEDTATRWHGTGLRGERITVALTGVDLAQYSPAPADARAATRRALGIAEDAFFVLYAGRIGREKGVDILVRAFAELSALRPECHLMVVGSPSLGADPADSAAYEAELRALAAGLTVSWNPAQPDVVALIQAADVAVAPSLWPEPLSRSVMEPLACGVPVVATRVGGNPEILTGWLSDFLVEPSDVPGLTARLASLHRWRSADPSLGDRCRREAEARLSLDTEVDTIEAELTGVVGARQGPWWRRRRTMSPTDARSCG
jgi:glycosyltransferase involved in cell wall biosynthesis